MKPFAWVAEYENQDGSRRQSFITDERVFRHCPPDFGEPVPLYTAADLARLKAREERLVAALEWAMDAGHLRYSARTRSNTAYCDGVDRCRAALAESGDPT